MNVREPFQQRDLEELGSFLDRGRVIPMCEVADGDRSPDAIGVRHDVDNVIERAVEMAEWEQERGYRSTYFILHTAPYWGDKDLLRRSLDSIASAGHEIGFHINAITAAITTGRDPIAITEEAVAELRGYGHRIRGVVAHGDPACYEHRFVNDEIFTESPRPDWGEPERVVGGVKINPVSRTAFGFDYDPNWLSRGDYLSDSGGVWSQSFDKVTERWPSGQLHMLIHPDWWGSAFVMAGAA